MKHLTFICLSVLLGLTASPALALSQKEASEPSIPQSTVAPNATGANTRMLRNADSMRDQTYRRYFPQVREGGNHQKPQYTS